MKNKFKINDVVIAHDGAPYGITTSGWKGRVVKIHPERDHHDIEVISLTGGTIYPVNSEYFSVCREPDKTEKVVIIRNGNEVHATKYIGKKKILTSTTVCSPSDEFSFATGASIALDRCLQACKEKEKEMPESRCLNMKICIVDAGNSSILETGRIYTIKDGKIQVNGKREKGYPVSFTLANKKDLDWYFCEAMNRKTILGRLGHCHSGVKYVEVIDD